jgi:hypothetical protein
MRGRTENKSQEIIPVVAELPWMWPGELPAETKPPVKIGDVVRVGNNFHPHYHVIALTADRAWIRNTQHGTDDVVPLDRCRRV